MADSSNDDGLPRPGGPLVAPNRCAPLIVNRQSCRAVTTSGLCAKSYFAPNGDRVRVTPCSRAPSRRVRFGPTQAPRQNAPARLHRLSPGLAFVVPARHRRRAALSYRVRVWAFSAIRGVSGKRSQTLNPLGGKT